MAYTLTQVVRILKPGGLLLVADEVRPRNPVVRLLQGLIRAPLAALTYLVAQQTTHPVAGLADRLTNAGLSIVSVDSSVPGSFSTFVARKAGARAP